MSIWRRRGGEKIMSNDISTSDLSNSNLRMLQLTYFSLQTCLRNTNMHAYGIEAVAFSQSAVLSLTLSLARTQPTSPLQIKLDSHLLCYSPTAFSLYERTSINVAYFLLQGKSAIPNTQINCY